MAASRLSLTPFSILPLSAAAPSPIHVILQSHKLFSQSFEEYAEIFDDVYLFDRAPPAATSDEMIRRSLQDEPAEGARQSSAPSSPAKDAGGPRDTGLPAGGGRAGANGTQCSRGRAL